MVIFFFIFIIICGNIFYYVLYVALYNIRKCMLPLIRKVFQKSIQWYYVLHVAWYHIRKKHVTPHSKGLSKIYTMVPCVACCMVPYTKKACYPSFERSF